jgi:hypothetical protein
MYIQMSASADRVPMLLFAEMFGYQVTVYQVAVSRIKL